MKKNQFSALRGLAAVTTFVSTGVALHGASSFTHFSGDDVISAPVTGSSISQVVEAAALTINNAYAGTDQAARSGTNGFFNAKTGGVPSSTRFAFAFDSVGGDITVTTGIGIGSSGQSFFEITTGAGVSSVSLNMSYLGQFDGSDVYNEGFTGRFSGNGGSPATPLRGVAIRSTSASEILNFAMSSTQFGGGADSMAASDFYNGAFSSTILMGDPYSTISGYGSGSVSGDFENNEGIMFHNGSDLGDVSSSIDLIVTADDGGAIAAGSSFRFTFDAMTQAAPIPEPSAALLLAACAGLGLGLRRRR